MKRTFLHIGHSLILASLLFLSSACTSDTCTAEYWVATDGSDEAVGDEAHPFLTLAHARDAVRNNVQRKTCTINVTVKGGTYRLAEPFALAPQDSGAEEAPVVYRASPGEEVIISGAERVGGWALHDAGLGIWKAQVATDALPRQLTIPPKTGPVETLKSLG